LKTLSIYKYTINERGAKFRRLCVLCIFTQILIFERPQYALKLKKTHGSSGMHEPACMLAAAAAAAGKCWLLLLLLAAAAGWRTAEASSSSSNQKKPAASSRAAAASMAAAWACCCFKTGMHGAWHAAASKPGCMVHGKLPLQQQQLLRACVRACVAACVIDTIYELTRRRRPRRGESNFRMEISTCFGGPLRTSSGGCPPSSS
jgi:hypothetical protein